MRTFLYAAPVMDWGEEQVLGESPEQWNQRGWKQRSHHWRLRNPRSRNSLTKNSFVINLYDSSLCCILDWVDLNMFYRALNSVSCKICWKVLFLTKFANMELIFPIPGCNWTLRLIFGWRLNINGFVFLWKSGVFLWPAWRQEWSLLVLHILSKMVFKETFRVSLILGSPGLVYRLN